MVSFVITNNTTKQNQNVKERSIQCQCSHCNKQYRNRTEKYKLRVVSLIPELNWFDIKIIN